MNADFTDVDQEPEDRMADRKMDLKPFRGLLEGWPPGLGKGEISGEWRREAKLPTGPSSLRGPRARRTEFQAR